MVAAVFYAPMAADVCGQAGGCGVAVGQVGDGVDGFGCPGFACLFAAADEPDCLGGVPVCDTSEVGGHATDFEAAGFSAAVLAIVASLPDGLSYYSDDFDEE